MTDFLLLGARKAEVREISPRRAGHDLVASLGWQRLLRQWGLLRAFAVADEPSAGLAACLLVRVSGQAAAIRLGASWEQLAGYQVTVLRLSGVHQGTGPP
jgi:hypothetical protein